MIVKSIHVKNFRSILDEQLTCDKLTILVGANGAGKSSFLRAIELFYGKAPKIEINDFYNENTTKEIVVSVTYTNLSEDERALFARYIQGTDLTIERILNWNDTKFTAKLYGSTLQNRDFQEFRETLQNSGARQARTKYEELRSRRTYSQFPNWSSASAAEECLKRWEIDNPSLCERMRDDGQFFGFTEVGEGYLGKFTMLKYIPAVRDASADATDKGDSVINEIMDLVVRNSLAEREEIRNFQSQTSQTYSDLVNPEHLAELGVLSESMNNTLQLFAPDSKVQIKWQRVEEFKVELPKAQVKLVEDGYETNVARTGHGLQRAFIMTLLQVLAQAQARVGSVEGSEVRQTGNRLPHLFLVIEEPELYQHPDRQRHLAKVLQELSEVATLGVAESTQVIYSTHSPHFVSMEKFDNVRLLRKTLFETGMPKVTKILFTSLDEVARELAALYESHAERFDPETVLWRFHAIMTPWMNEGFFAKIVVLVEGEEDRTAILEISRILGYDLESIGIAVIPCFGKPNLDRPAIIFRRLHIPVYIIWDGDSGRDPDPKLNRRLLKLMRATEVDWPNAVTETFSCFAKDLDTTIRAEIGSEFYSESFARQLEKLEISRGRAADKNAIVLREIIKDAYGAGKRCATIEAIVDKILRLTAA